MHSHVRASFVINCRLLNVCVYEWCYRHDWFMYIYKCSLWYFPNAQLLCNHTVVMNNKTIEISWWKDTHLLHTLNLQLSELVKCFIKILRIIFVSIDRCHLIVYVCIASRHGSTAFYDRNFSYASVELLRENDTNRFTLHVKFDILLLIKIFLPTLDCWYI